MKIEVKIDVSRNKYGASLANTELTLDSDEFDKDTVAALVTGMVRTALVRAEDTLAGEKPKTPESTTL